MKEPPAGPPGTLPDNRANSFGSITNDAPSDREQEIAANREVTLDKAMLDAVLDALPVGVIIADADGKIVRANAASRELWGAPPGTTNWDGYTDWAGSWPDTGQRLKDEDWPMARTLRSGEIVRNELIQSEHLATGERRFFLSNSAPIFDQDGRVIAAAVVEVDVTQRRKAQEALGESEERFASFMRHLPGLAWIKNAEGQYVYVNDAAEKAFQTSRAALYGKTDEEVFPPPTAAQFRANDISAMASEAGFVTVETLRHEDGVLHHSLVSKFPIRDAAGRYRGIGGVAIDITERVLADRKLMEATERLREADKRKDEFLATLAHELRNPLAAIRSGLLVVRKSSGSGPGAERMQEIMERQIAHLVRLVDDLLEVSRINHGKIELKNERVDLAVVVAQAVETTRALTEEEGLELRVTLPDRPLPLDADPIRLTQAVTNLLSNAVKYTTRGGQIEVTVEREDDQAVVAVADTGLGISSEMLPRVFDLFTQAGRTLGRAGGGLGIGLSLVQRIVRLHGGDVEAQSEGEGRGSRFIIRLPLPVNTEAEAPSAPEATARRVAPSSRRVLVVDDTPDVADSLALLLETLGAQVRVAYGGREALLTCAEFEPEVVLLDIGMPEMDGFETARRMRDQPAGCRATLVALSGWGEGEMRRRIEEAGFDRRLTKPADLSELERLLETVRSKDPNKGAEP